MIRRVAVGISGGVDSAVAAHILKKKGYEIVGVFMRNWDTTNEKGVCMTDLDLEDAEYVCHKLDIPLFEVNFVKEYWTNVFSELLLEYQNGRTPNPDIACNKHVKFSQFLKYSLETLECDAIATGHYARTDVGYDLHAINDKTGVKLLTAADTIKDQTFFLSQIKQSALRKSLFPIGDITKTFVHKIAVEAGLQKISNKKESMGICFIGSRSFHDFIEEYIEPKEGNFVNIETGEIVGQHKGIHYWTMGQRCLIGGLNKAYFVVDFNLSTNDIIVAQGTNHPSLFYKNFSTEVPHWICHPPNGLKQTEEFSAKFRYQHKHPLIDCTAVSADNGHGLLVTLERPMRALCLGQYAVFYHEDQCLGSAKINRKGPSLYMSSQTQDVSNPREFS